MTGVTSFPVFQKLYSAQSIQKVLKQVSEMLLDRNPSDSMITANRGLTVPLRKQTRAMQGRQMNTWKATEAMNSFFLSNLEENQGLTRRRAYPLA